MMIFNPFRDGLQARTYLTTCIFALSASVSVAHDASGQDIGRRFSEGFGFVVNMPKQPMGINMTILLHRVGIHLDYKTDFRHRSDGTPSSIVHYGDTHDGHPIFLDLIDTGRTWSSVELAVSYPVVRHVDVYVGGGLATNQKWYFYRGSNGELEKPGEGVVDETEDPSRFFKATAGLFVELPPLPLAIRVGYESRPRGLGLGLVYFFDRQ